MEALKTTFLPNFIAIKDNLHKIGRIRRVINIFCQYSSRYDAYKQGNLPNIFNPTFSTGSLMDIGIYCVYPVICLFGKPKEVIACGKVQSDVNSHDLSLSVMKVLDEARKQMGVMFPADSSNY